jgi:Spy/CpxP family protein refolding chaperone
MKAVNLVIAILVALAVGGVAFYMASAQTAELEKTVKDLEDELTQTKVDLALANKKLEEADTTKLQSQVDELSENLWARVEDLGKKDAELEAEIGKLASRPAPVAAPVVAGNPGDAEDPNVEPEEKMARDLMKGVGRMITRGMGDFTGRQVDRYKKQLDLTDTQAEDVKKIMADSMKKFGDQMRKRFEGGGDGGDFDPRTAFEDLMKERDDALKDVLTPEQFDKLKELEKNQGMRWGGFGGGRRGGGGGDQDRNR